MITVNLDVIAPVILVPVLILTAAQGIVWTVIAFIACPILIYVFYVKFLHRKQRTKFFFCWSIYSLVFLMGVFELEVIPYLEILLSENIVLKALVVTTLICVYFVKADPGYVEQQPSASCTNDPVSEILNVGNTSFCAVCNVAVEPIYEHCKMCNTCVLRKDHHCIWLDSCIGKKNHRAYLCTIFFLLLTNLYGANLTLTTVCHPVFVGDIFLLPNNCDGVYDNMHIAVCFASAIYMLVIAVVSLASFLHQIWLISIGVTVNEWRLSARSSGVLTKKDECYDGSRILRNWRKFCRDVG